MIIILLLLLFGILFFILEYIRFEILLKNQKTKMNDKKCPVENTPNFKECKNCDDCVVINSFKK